MSGTNPSPYSFLSPADYRYYVKDLEPYLSEESFIKYKCRVEVALAQTLAERGLISADAAQAVEAALPSVTAKAVYEEEGRTGHDIIALVNVIRSHMPEEARPAVHRTATSYDVVDTANVLRYRDAFTNVILRDMVALEEVLVDICRSEKDTLQIGRTHLQHAEPLTFGFAMSWFVSRFGNCILRVDRAVKDLRGKFSGSVGSYDASALFLDDPEAFEMDVLKRLGLEPCEISTQVVQPEAMTDLVHSVTMAFTVLANLADDLRNLQRPEIAEVGQPRGEDVSRSSTMPHKANPVGLENVKSLWKTVMPFMTTMYLDMISDHQRDLTNSASQRNVPQLLDLFDYSVRRMTRILKGLKPHRGNMLRNLEMNRDKIIAEPLQLLLSGLGHPKAHEYVSHLSDQSYSTGKPLDTIVWEDEALKPYLAKLTEKQRQVLQDPTKYIGIASEKALKIAKLWKERMRTV